MFSIRIQSVINHLVKQELLYDFSRRDESSDLPNAIAFSLSLSLDFFSGEPNKQFSSRRSLHLVYHNLRGSNTVSVFAGVSSRPFSLLKDVELRHQASHDSCWRNPSIFSKLYFEMADEVNAQLIEKGGVAIAPIEMFEHNIFSDRGPLFSRQRAIVGKDPTDPNDYHRLITLVKPDCTFCDGVEGMHTERNCPGAR